MFANAETQAVIDSDEPLPVKVQAILDDPGLNPHDPSVINDPAKMQNLLLAFRQAVVYLAEAVK